MSNQDNVRDDIIEQPSKEQRRRGRAPPLPQQPAAARVMGVPVVQDWPMRDVNHMLIVKLALGIINPQASPERAKCVDDDDYFLRDGDSIDALCPHIDMDLPRKRRALADEASGRCTPTTHKQKLFDKLTDDLLLHVFRFMPRARDRASCAAVSKRCLKLQSHMQRHDFYVREKQPHPCKLRARADDKRNELVNKMHRKEAPPRFIGSIGDVRVERQPLWAMGDLSRHLHGKQATDVRLAAIAVGTCGLGGLAKLRIQGGGLARVSDEGLLAIGHCCAALRTLKLCDCSAITDKSMTAIGEGCRLLQKIELQKCPLIGDSGMLSIIKNAISITGLSLGGCPLIGDAVLHAVSTHCPGLKQFNLRDCPLVSDDGLESVIQSCEKLHDLRLHGLQMSDGVLMSIGVWCKALATLSLGSLNSVTGNGFLSLCNALSAAVIRRLGITNCPGFNNSTLLRIGKRFQELKYISLTRCEGISDQGLMGMMQIAFSLQILHVDGCDHITGAALTSALSSQTGKLQGVYFNACMGMQDYNIDEPSFVLGKSVVRSLCLAGCDGLGDACLSLVGCLCEDQLTDLDFTGLTRVTDKGLLAVLNSAGSKLTSVNVTGCTNVTDVVVETIAKQCGGTLRCLLLDGCEKVTDEGFLTLGEHCVVLEELHISKCSITDLGVQAVVSKVASMLIHLHLSGCRGVTDRILSFIEERCPTLKLKDYQ